jgi:hypothetical protein
VSPSFHPHSFVERLSLGASSAYPFQHVTGTPSSEIPHPLINDGSLTIDRLGAYARWQLPWNDSGGSPVKSKLAFVVFVVSLIFVDAPLYAHHGFEIEYDGSKYITVTGVLTKVDWENPHIYFNVDAKDPDGKMTSWRFEGSSVAIVERTGTRRRDLVDNIGQIVTVSACPGKGGVARGAAEKLKLPDGREIIIARQRFYGETGGPGKNSQ